MDNHIEIKFKNSLIEQEIMNKIIEYKKTRIGKADSGPELIKIIKEHLIDHLTKMCMEEISIETKREDKFPSIYSNLFGEITTTIKIVKKEE